MDDGKRRAASGSVANDAGIATPYKGQRKGKKEREAPCKQGQTAGQGGAVQSDMKLKTWDPAITGIRSLAFLVLSSASRQNGGAAERAQQRP
jgi:hypothetical protein